jgi:outer membrane protein assembly factor BamB
MLNDEYVPRPAPSFAAMSRSMMKSSRFLALAVGCVFSLHLLPDLAAEPDWSDWRGPTRDGHSTDPNLPTQWSADDIEWKVPLGGEGHSSPCVWGEQIFLTRSDNRGAQRFVFCINRGDGEKVWEKLAWEGTPEPTHNMNGWASASCATDGELVFAFFGKGGGLHCYTTGGVKVWDTGDKLGDFEGPWGTAATPVLYKNLVIQNCDADRNAFLIAFDKKTGEEAWKTKREDFRGWSTPVLIEVDGKMELALNSHSGVYAYDPATGKELWYCKGYNGRGSPTVTPGANGLLHVVNGKPGDVYAIKPGGRGDVTNTHQVWHTTRRGGRDLPSPIVVDGQMLVVSMQGVLTSYDSDTGKELWKDRLGGNYCAAPIAYKGLAFFLNEDNGEVVAVKPDKKLNIVAKNQISNGESSEELFRSALVPDDGQLLLRSTTTLYCIGKRTEKKGE